MLMKRILILGLAIVSMVAVLAALSQTASAAVPVVKTVPWVASNPLIPHDTWSGKSIRLKGTSDQQGANIQYTWDFGDGSAVATGTVTNQRVVEATHAYTDATGTVFTATLTIQNTTSGETGTAKYYVVIQDKSLPVETNVAIDEGLWFLHKDMTPYLTNQGYWANNYNTETPANLNAFFVNGHLENGASSNPYTDTVQRGMRRLFTLLTVTGIPSSQTYPAPIGTVNPDSNGNGLAIYGYDSYVYSSGIYIDAIVASGTPDAVTTTGPGNVTGRKYKDIVQDMVDGYAYGQADSGTWMGGWGYDWNNGNSDNSVNQWAVIGMMAAEGWGGTVVVPSFVKAANKNSLNNTQATTANCSASYDGAFSYTNNHCYFPWGPYGTTAAGMVQMVFDGIGRGNAQWDRTENYLRNNFCNAGNSQQAIKAYYYGLFSFTKSMLLTPGGGIQELTNRPSGANPIDWYSAEASAGDACDGVARTLVNGQLSGGNWSKANAEGYHASFTTAWAIIMLNRTVFQSGLPVAVASAVPNPAVAGQTVNLSGAGSFHQDSSRTLTAWAWDLDNNGTFEKPGVTAAVSFPALGSYPVKLRVTDDISQSAITTLNILVNTPPLAPTANAGGPYNFCQGKKWFLDGSGSINPDNGLFQPGHPADYIKEYAWDLDGNNSFNDAFGVAPEITGALSLGPHVIQLRVKDNTAASFPSSGLPDLTGVDSAVVTVRSSTDSACISCISNLAARPKLSKVQLTWAPKAGAHHYNIYRGTVAGGPYVKIGTTTSAYSTYLDSAVSVGSTYYYVVRPASVIDAESCQSNEAMAKVTTR